MFRRMPLSAKFQRSNGSASEVVGPYGVITLLGGSVLGDDVEIAKHVGNKWETPGGTFVRFDVEQSVYLWFDSNAAPSKRFGPFTAFSCLDGVAYADSQVFAFCDDKQDTWL